MKKYAIKHKPTNKWHYEDEAVIVLTETPENLMNHRVLCESRLGEEAEENNNMIWTEDGEFPVDEFEVVEFNVNKVK